MSRHSGYAYGHGKHSYTCTCGKTVIGNGGKAAHRAMHKRRGDSHRFLTAVEAYEIRARERSEGVR